MSYSEEFIFNDALFTSFIAHIGYIEEHGVKAFSIGENGFVSFKTDSQEELEEIGITTQNNLGFFVSDFEILDENHKIIPNFSAEYRKFAAAYFGMDYVQAVSAQYPDETELLSKYPAKVEAYKNKYNKPSTHAIIENCEDPNVSEICSAINFYLESDEDIFVDFVQQINPNATDILICKEGLTCEWSITIREGKRGYLNKYTASLFEFRDNFTKQDLTTEWQSYFSELLAPADDVYFDAYDKFIAAPRDVANSVNLLSCQIVESKNIAFKVMAIKRIMEICPEYQPTKPESE